MIGPWGEEGSWLRCQLHCHTTCSDGDPSPEELCAHYAGAGYHVVAITDHWHITVHEHDGLLLIPSAELSARVTGGAEEADVLAYGIDRLPEVRDTFPTVEDCARWIVAEGGVAYLAHPYWSGLAPGHCLDAPSLSGLEVWNGASELIQGNGLSGAFWDDVLHRGGRPFGIATDDSHSAGHDSLVGWTWVRAVERSRAAVLAALRSGSFYGSSGPTIEAVWVEDDGSVGVRCGPARAVFLRSGPWDGCSANADPAVLSWRGRVVERASDGAIVEALFELPEYWRWGRVEVVDAVGRKAWSNPFTLPGEAAWVPSAA